jgi:hypothetical protein
MTIASVNATANVAAPALQDTQHSHHTKGTKDKTAADSSTGQIAPAASQGLFSSILQSVSEIAGL